MGSLQDQLLKAGLATPEQLRKMRAEQRRESRGRRDSREGSRTSRGRPSGSPPDRGDASVRVLNLRIRELLDRHTLNDRNAEITFNFARENVIRRVNVTDEQRRKLAAGELAIVGFRRRHHLVPAEVAEEIRTLRPIVFVHRAAPEGADAPSPAADDEDDPYREFPVPDDLRW